MTPGIRCGKKVWSWKEVALGRIQDFVLGGGHIGKVAEGQPGMTGRPARPDCPLGLAGRTLT